MYFLKILFLFISLSVYFSRLKLFCIWFHAQHINIGLNKQISALSTECYRRVVPQSSEKRYGSLSQTEHMKEREEEGRRREWKREMCWKKEWAREGKNEKRNGKSPLKRYLTGGLKKRKKKNLCSFRCFEIRPSLSTCLKAVLAWVA